MLRLFAESSDTVVGAHQLSNVSWSVLFDDVELTAADVARLAKQARPLVRSRNGWVEVDRVDLEQAAAALAERAEDRQLTGAEILRHSLGLDGAGLRVDVRGHSWATDILARAAEASTSPVTRPEGFTGELRSYQAEALAWIGFLERADLGGCLALDMGLGKTPTVLAHLARAAASGPALVIAPAAVVGNWAAEAARFVPGLRVVIHHGTSRATAAELAAEIDAADVLITTYATAVRDIDALAASRWATCVLDEAQAIKNPASETAQQLRRIPSRMRLALTGTPIENGLGDLWAILDFTNPGLVGTRPAFVAQLAGDAESALRALNGLLVFRRTKREPEVAAELPDKIDELDHCTMTPEQIGLYQAVLDELVADVADADAGGEQQEGSHPRGDHRAQADLQPPGRLPRRRPAPRRALRQARPAGGDRRGGVRRRRARAGVHALRHVGTAPRRPPQRDHRDTGRLLRRQPGAWRPRPHRHRVPAGHRPRRAGAVAEGRRHRAEPHRRQPRRAVRPVVEPGRRGSSPRPCLADRTATQRHLPPPRVPRHHRRTRRGGRRRQTPHRPTRPAPIQLDRRPRRRSAPPRPRTAARRTAHGRLVMNQPAKRRRPTRRTTAHRPTRTVDPWRVPAPLPDVEPMPPPDDVAALLHSLGDPTLAGGGSLASYFSAVVERAASVATALALSTELPAAPPDDKRSDPSD